MKRAFCILIIMMVLVYGTAFADQHLEMMCIFSGEAENAAISLDLYEQEGKVIAVSSLFPEYAAVTGRSGSFSVTAVNTILSLSYEDIAGIPDTTDAAIMSWLGQKMSAHEKGIYAGDLFTGAESVATAEFRLSEMIAFLRDIPADRLTGGDSDYEGAAALSLIADVVGDCLKNYDPVIIIQSFDQGSFLTCRVTEQDEVFMNVSVDRSAEKEKRLLISYRENSRYCYRMLTVKNEEDHISFLSSFDIGEHQSYQTIAEKEPLLSEELTISDGNDGTFSFRCILTGTGLSEPMYVTGATVRQNNGQTCMNATIGIGDPETRLISLSIIPETLNRAVSFSDKAMIDAADKKESALIPITAASNMAMIVSGILPALPDDYQKMIMNLLSP